MAHTRGPWTYRYDNDVGPNDEGFWEFYRVKSADVRIAEVITEDDARLIAAAPELHALLIESLDLVPRMSDDDPIAPALAEWCKRVRAAIAKATS